MFYQHLRGPFSAWMNTGKITKRILIGPTPKPVRPFAAYHTEALRWYDHYLKGMDTGVLDGAPIHLGFWARISGGTSMSGPSHEPMDGVLSRGNGRQRDAQRHPAPRRRADPRLPAGHRSVLWGQPRWVYRSSPLDQPMEITGPIQLNLVMASSADGHPIGSSGFTMRRPTESCAS